MDFGRHVLQAFNRRAFFKRHIVPLTWPDVHLTKNTEYGVCIPSTRQIKKIIIDAHLPGSPDLNPTRLQHHLTKRVTSIRVRLLLRNNATYLSPMCKPAHYPRDCEEDREKVEGETCHRQSALHEHMAIY